MKTLETKSCSKCKEVKPLSVFPVYKNKPFSWCRPCQIVSALSYRKRNLGKCKAYAKKYREENKEHLLELNQKWRKDNPEKVKAQNHKTWITHKDKINARNRERFMKSYGITVAKYEEMLKAQGGVCAICSNLNALNRRLSVDHDHKTGEVRGLLCNRCNLSIGKFEDDTTILMKAVKYLEDSNV